MNRELTRRETVLLLILVGVVVIRVVLKLLDRVLARSKSLRSLSRFRIRWPSIRTRPLRSRASWSRI